MSVLQERSLREGEEVQVFTRLECGEEIGKEGSLPGHEGGRGCEEEGRDDG